jgi:ribosomal-protein-alanine N-acetyltransferase
MVDLSLVRLRPWQKKDIFVLAQLADDYDVASTLRNSFPHPYTVEDAQRWVSFNLSQPEPNPIKAIEYNGNLVGCVGAFFKDDVYSRNAEIGYWLGKRYWGKGIASVAVGLLVDYLFNNFVLHRLYGEVFSNNEASCRVLAKNGFALEARLKGHVYKNDAYLDCFIYALMKSDWSQKTEKSTVDL